MTYPKTETAMDRYQFRLITSMAEMGSIRSQWEALQQHPLTDYEFYSLIMETRAETVSPCILAVSDGNRPVCLLLGRREKARNRIQVGYAKFGTLAVRQFVFLAGGCLGETTPALWARILDHIDSLMRQQQVDLAIFEHVELSSPLFPLIASHPRLGSRFIATEGDKHWLLSLPSSWESFLAGRSRKHRYWLNRLPRVLDREFCGQWAIRRYDSAALAMAFVDAAETVASKSYHRRLGVGFHGDTEYTRRVALDAERERLRGYVLFIKDEPKAFWYCFVYKGTLHLAATAFDPAYRDYELGTIVLMRVFEDHCGTEVKLVDFGLGDADYKRRFGSDYQVEGPINLYSGSLRGTLLRWLGGTTLALNKLGKRLLSSARLAQYVKTRWRRKLSTH